MIRRVGTLNFGNGSSIPTRTMTPALTLPCKGVAPAAWFEMLWSWHLNLHLEEADCKPADGKSCLRPILRVALPLRAPCLVAGSRRDLAASCSAGVGLVCGSAFILLAVMVLLGWVMRSEMLISVLPGRVSMKANTAIWLFC